MSGAWHLKLPWSVDATVLATTSEPIVRLLHEPRRLPATPAERRAVALLTREGPLPLRRLVDGVSRDLYRDELRRDGWATEIGWVGSALFRADAGEAVEQGAGALWTIDPAAG